MKAVAALCLLLFFLIFSSHAALAAPLQLTLLGSVDTSNKNYTQFWYSTPNPRLAGTAGANALVTITIDSTPVNTTAAADGTWSYTPTTLMAGDHQLTLSSGTETKTMSLHIGQSTTNTATPSASTSSTASATSLPVTGALSSTLILLAFGAGFIVTGLKFSRHFS